ncbi:COPII coat Sec23p-Sfb3p heterodimer component [Chytriomyces hyalinus]|nr:COPII coat Sec23p-Sfb3p heterodimer component [Chytriomyces hyalinus]
MPQHHPQQQGFPPAAGEQFRPKSGPPNIPGAQSVPPTGAHPGPNSNFVPQPMGNVTSPTLTQSINAAGNIPPPAAHSGGIATNRAKRVYASTNSQAMPPQGQNQPPVPAPGFPSAPQFGGPPAQQGNPQQPGYPQHSQNQFGASAYQGGPQTQGGMGFAPPSNGFNNMRPPGPGPMQQPMPGQQQQQQQQYMQGGQQQQPQAPRSKIDPNQIPSPLVVHELDQTNYEGHVYSTGSRTVPPLAATRFKVSDEGNCSPRFMRLTTYQIPATEELLNTSMLPMGAIVQPLADLAPDEMPVPVVDFGEGGPLRCRRCRAYINPWFNFTDGGRKMICNLCACDTEVPPEYFCNLDMSGRRMDLASRPELLYGAIEFKASKEYSVRPAKPPSYVFGIDVSWNSVSFGVLRNAVAAIQGLLYEGETGGLPKGSLVGIFTFDRSVHFYNLKSALEQPHMLVVPDVNDMFVPLSEGFLVDPWESRTVIENLLNSLPALFEGNRVAESILGAAAQAAMLAMKDLGGKLFLFQTSLPTHGPGALKNREDAKLLNTENEKKLYEPQEYFWRKMGEDYSKHGICCDLFLFPNAYVDVATVGSLSALTGGDCMVYTNFDAGRDGLRFREDLKKIGRRNFGFEGLLRVRCSDGIGVSHHFGNFCIRSSNPTDVELAGIDSQKAIGIAFKHDRKLDENGLSAFQVALLYTNFAGERRIRVLNLSVPNTGTMGNVFRCAEMDTTINYLAKASVAQAAASSLKAVRDQLTDRCVKILAAYRKHSASNTSPGQLILPESFKLYPLYTLSLLKTKAFRTGMMSSDARIASMRHLRNMGVPETVPFFYPRMFAVHTFEPEFRQMDGRNNIKLPPCMRVSYERLDPEGIFLLENGTQMFCWVGRQTSPELIQNIFGVPRVEEIDIKMRMLPVLENKLNANVRLAVQLCQMERPRYLQLQVVRQQLDPPLESEFASYLAEDPNHDNMNYVDFLCFIHRDEFGASSSIADAPRNISSNESSGPFTHRKFIALTTLPASLDLLAEWVLIAKHLKRTLIMPQISNSLLNLPESPGLTAQSLSTLIQAYNPSNASVLDGPIISSLSDYIDIIEIDDWLQQMDARNERHQTNTSAPLHLSAVFVSNVNEGVLCSSLHNALAWPEWISQRLIQTQHRQTCRSSSQNTCSAQVVSPWVFVPPRMRGGGRAPAFSDICLHSPENLNPRIESIHLSKNENALVQVGEEDDDDKDDADDDESAGAQRDPKEVAGQSVEDRLREAAKEEKQYRQLTRAYQSAAADVVSKLILNPDVMNADVLFVRKQGTQRLQPVIMTNSIVQDFLTPHENIRHLVRKALRPANAPLIAVRWIFSPTSDSQTAAKDSINCAASFIRSLKQTIKRHAWADANPTIYFSSPMFPQHNLGKWMTKQQPAFSDYPPDRHVISTYAYLRRRVPGRFVDPNILFERQELNSSALFWRVWEDAVFEEADVVFFKVGVCGVNGRDGTWEETQFLKKIQYRRGLRRQYLDGKDQDADGEDVEVGPETVYRMIAWK